MNSVIISQVRCLIGCTYIRTKISIYWFQHSSDCHYVLGWEGKWILWSNYDWNSDFHFVYLASSNICLAPVFARGLSMTEAVWSIWRYKVGLNFHPKKVSLIFSPSSLCRCIYVHVCTLLGSTEMIQAICSQQQLNHYILSSVKDSNGQAAAMTIEQFTIQRLLICSHCTYLACTSETYIVSNWIGAH